MYKFNDKKTIILTLVTVAVCLVISVVLFISNRLDENESKNSFDPEQIHLAIGDDISQMVISWSTRSDPEQSFVRFGEITCNKTRLAMGTKRLLDSGGVVQYIHFVTLKHLIPGLKYCYYVGSDKKWSRRYNFFAFPNHHKWSPSVALIGDMGVENSRAVPSLIRSTIKGYFDAVIHVGDIGYNLYAFNGLMGDKFMRNIEPIAARVPYMVVPGNHEYVCYDFRCPSDFGISYETRFKMPRSTDNTHYTFTLGPALFIAINTEVYYQQEMSDLEAYQTQYDWLENVLIDANKPENRARHPWIIVYGHRPLYCTSIGECFDGMTVLYKQGPAIDGSLFDIEDLLYAYGVDVAFWGHQHYYERFYPVYNQTTYVNSMYKDAFVNPRAPVYIISGVGGMHSGTEPFSPTPALWTAFRSSAYGYTHFIVANESHMLVEQIDVDQNDKVIDSVWIIQEEHVPFGDKNKNLVQN